MCFPSIQMMLIIMMMMRILSKVISGKYNSHKNRHHLLSNKEIKSRGRKKSNKEKKLKQWKHTHMCIAEIIRILKVEQTDLMCYDFFTGDHFYFLGSWKRSNFKCDVHKYGEFSSSFSGLQSNSTLLHVHIRSFY